MILLVLWVVLFADVTVQTQLVAGFGYLVGQVIIVSCSALVVIWFDKRKKG